MFAQVRPTSRFPLNPQPILQNSKFQAFVRGPLPFRKEEIEDHIREFFVSLLAVRTEFWNGGFRRDSIYEAVDAKDHSVLRQLLDAYSRVIRKIDPQENGVIPNPLPDLPVVQRVYSDLLKVNKELYQFLHKGLGRELEKLAGSVNDI